MRNWDKLAEDKTIQATAKAIEARGIEVFVVDTKGEALRKIKALIPKGSEVMNGTSTTLQQIGYSDYLKAGEHGWIDLHEKIGKEDNREKRSGLRRQASAAEYFLGSVNAISQNGELVAADASGSRVTAYPFAAKHVILVAGAQKIMPNLEKAMQRVREYVFPLENERAKKVYGSGSNTSKWVIIEKESVPGRMKLILIKEKLGF
ncbi:MAG TPA: lactate utilization protein [archaeon]|nr:lactate utilization protein [archaeon]